jgi:Fe-Mn family superoxide dismutase
MFILPDLPYGYEALAPLMSSETLHFHHDKHHAAYVKKTNTLAREAKLAGKTLEGVIRGAHERGEKSLFNNAAQAWNHAFFWRSMSPDKSAPGGELADAIGEAFGDLDTLGAAFVKAGVEQFGSGWVWLAADDKGLKVLSTHDAENPLTQQGLTPLIVCDLWEHAYYLDHQNEREAFLTGWFETLADWSFATQQLAAARGHGVEFTYPAPMAG